MLLIKLHRRNTVFVALLVLALSGGGLQPFSASTLPNCNCQAKFKCAGEDSSRIKDTCCCAAKAEKSSCCSQKKPSSKCCCNPDALVCLCVDCKCGQKQQPTKPLPAIPTNETNEVCPPTLICLTASVNYPRNCSSEQTGFPSVAVTHRARSSQQTCILLSRFTC